MHIENQPHVCAYHRGEPMNTKAKARLARVIDCPVCPAKAGEVCLDDRALLVDARYPRENNHQLRVMQAYDLFVLMQELVEGASQ